MLTSKQLQIFSVFIQNPFREYSFGEIKQYSGEKSNSVTQNAIKRFLCEKLVTERKIGTSKLYTINHENEAVYHYFELVLQEKLPEPVKRSVLILKSEIEKYTIFYSIVVFGSYADNTSKRSSDLDIAIMIPDKTYERNMKIAVNSGSNKSPLQLDVQIITTDDFLEMLRVDYANVGKEIARKNLALHNSNIFYKIVRMGIGNGFRIIS